MIELTLGSLRARKSKKTLPHLEGAFFIFRFIVYELIFENLLILYKNSEFDNIAEIDFVFYECILDAQLELRLRISFVSRF